MVGIHSIVRHNNFKSVSGFTLSWKNINQISKKHCTFILCNFFFGLMLITYGLFCFFLVGSYNKWRIRGRSMWIWLSQWKIQEERMNLIWMSHCFRGKWVFVFISHFFFLIVEDSLWKCYDELAELAQLTGIAALLNLPLPDLEDIAALFSNSLAQLTGFAALLSSSQLFSCVCAKWK